MATVTLLEQTDMTQFGDVTTSIIQGDNKLQYTTALSSVDVYGTFPPSFLSDAAGPTGTATLAVFDTDDSSEQS